MIKGFVRSIIIGLAVFAGAVIIFGAVFKMTYKNAAERIETAVPISEASVSAEPIREEEVTKPDFYIARFDGKSIAIYASADGKEEFLYTINAAIRDISEAEIEKLKGGIVISDKQALASFEEDFTS